MHRRFLESEQDAKDKLGHRCKRVNWGRVLIKFNNQNGCTVEVVDCFCVLPYGNKLFTPKHWLNEKMEKTMGVLLYRAVA